MLQGEGEFPLVLESSLGCDSLLLVNIAYTKVYFPNIFSPNSIIGNNEFRPIIAEGVNASVRMSIFDRWGSQIYQGSVWDGQDYPSGVYVYKVDILFEQGDPEVFYGEVTMLR